MHTVHNWSPAFLLNYQTKAELYKNSDDCKFRKLLGNILWHVLVAFFKFKMVGIFFFLLILLGFISRKKKVTALLRLPRHGKYFILHLIPSRISMRVINSFPLLYYCYGIMIGPFTEWHFHISHWLSAERFCQK